MSDIFISYSRDDREKAQELAEFFERQGWSVWWDRNIPTGKKYSQIIAEELAAAKSIVVLWSGTSTVSDWVKDEAQEGVNRGLLVPILIENVTIPFGFRQHQAANLSDWDGSTSHPEMKMLVEGISRLINKPGGLRDTSGLKKKSPFSGGRSPIIAGVAGVGALALVAAIFFGYRNFTGGTAPSNPANNNRREDIGSNRPPENRNGRPGQQARVNAARLTADGIEKASNGNNEGAILMYNEAIAAFPDYADAYYYRGQSFVAIKQPDRAVADFNKFLQLATDKDDRARVSKLLADIQSPPPPPRPDRTTAPPPDSVRADVRKMFSPDKTARIASTTNLIVKNKQDPKAMLLAIETAKKDPGNKSGVINTLVLLESMDPEILRANRAEIEELLKLVSGNGPETLDHVSKVRAIIGRVAS